MDKQAVVEALKRFYDQCVIKGEFTEARGVFIRDIWGVDFCRVNRSAFRELKLLKEPWLQGEFIDVLFGYWNHCYSQMLSAGDMTCARDLHRINVIMNSSVIIHTCSEESLNPETLNWLLEHEFEQYLNSEYPVYEFYDRGDTLTTKVYKMLLHCKDLPPSLSSLMDLTLNSAAEWLSFIERVEVWLGTQL